MVLPAPRKVRILRCIKEIKRESCGTKATHDSRIFVFGRESLVMGKLLEHLHSEDILCHAYIGDAENVSLNEKSVEIRKEKSGNNTYTDVYVNGTLAYMAGEVCIVVDVSATIVTLFNENNEPGFEEFSVSLEHFRKAFTPARCSG